MCVRHFSKSNYGLMLGPLCQLGIGCVRVRDFSIFSSLLSLTLSVMVQRRSWLEMFDTRDGRARATARAVDTYIAYYPTTVSHTKYTGTPLRPPRGISAISRRLRCLATDRPPVVAWSAHPDPRLITVMSHTPKVHQRRQAAPAAGRPLPTHARAHVRAPRPFAARSL